MTLHISIARNASTGVSPVLRQGSTSQVNKNEDSASVWEVCNMDDLGDESFTSWFAGACI